MTLLEAIEALGTTPEQVSSKLRDMGIKGYRRMASSCPIAKYVKACGFPHVTVATYVKVYQDRGSDIGDVADQTHLLPQGVRDWIAGFDEGEYPEFYLE